MKNLISLSLLAVTLVTTSGCSKFRSLTRRDYAFLSDPFARRGDGSEEAPPVDAEPSTSGYATIADTEPEPVKANYAAVSQSKSTENAGPSGFQGIRVRGMGDAISTEIGSSGSEGTDRAANGSALLANTDFENKKAQPKTNASPKPEVAETLLPQLPAMAAAKPESAETDSELLAEFADFAASKNAKWTAEVQEAEEKAAPLIKQPIRQVSDTVSKIDETVTAASEEGEKATPLLLQQAVRQVERQESPLARPIMPERPAAAVSSVEVAEPVFDTPMAPVASQERWNAAAPEIGVSSDTAKTTEPHVFDTPSTNTTEQSPLIDGAKPVRENPFALIAQESKSTQDSVQPTIKPAPSFDDFAAPVDQKQTTAPTDAKDEEPTWFATPAESSQSQTIDSGFNFDDAWKPVDADRP